MRAREPATTSIRHDGKRHCGMNDIKWVRRDTYQVRMGWSRCARGKVTGLEWHRRRTFGWPWLRPNFRDLTPWPNLV
jgi:hypothetical protein